MGSIKRKGKKTMGEFAKCDDCGKEMAKGQGCTLKTLEIDGLSYDRIPYAPGYIMKNQSCQDCNVMRGQIHHLGCDMERCPICGGQLIGCGCFAEEEEEYDEYPDDEGEGERHDKER